MEELFRFYAIRAADPPESYSALSLDTGSGQQTALLATAGSGIKNLAETFLNRQRDALTTLAKSSDSAAVHQLLGWARNAVKEKGLTDVVFDRTLRAQLSKLLGATPAAVIEKNAATGRKALVLDALVCLRVWNPNEVGLRRLFAGTDGHQFAATLVEWARFDALLGATDAPFTVSAAMGALAGKFVSDIFDLVPVDVAPKPAAPSPVELLATAAACAADLTRLLVRLQRAAPLALITTAAGPATLSAAVEAQLEAQFAGLPKRIDTALNNGVEPAGPYPDGWLGGGWSGVYNDLEGKARELQKVIDALTLTAANSGTPVSPVTNQLATPLVAGYLRMAGMTDVKVVRAHVLRYEGGEIAQIENVLQGETRRREFRTLNRREDDTQSQTETQTTDEKEIKTEDKSSLKSSVDQTLKENLDLKVGFDLKAKVGENLQIGLNTSFGYSRSSEETKKESTDFAKDVTNRAARKVSETVRTSIETKILQETEETIHHDFVASTSGGNIVGLYQWIEKVNRVQVFTIGSQKRAVMDGVVLQPGQRLLGSPAQATTTPAPVPPPTLDTSPSDIHPWNYLSLAFKFGAQSVPAPPPLTQCVSFSSAGPQGGGDRTEKTYAVAQDLALPDGTSAAWATVSYSSEIDQALDHEHAIVVVGAQTWTLTGSNDAEKLAATDGDTREIFQTGMRVLGGERLALPFTFYGGRIGGYAVALDVVCVRGQEAYEAWQVSVYGALKSAQAKAQQDYDAKTARATLEQAYDVGPSPGRIDQVVREEIKRCAISILAKQSAAGSLYDDINGMYGAGDYASVAQRVLFFEHALEWENMTYILYPYFWADGRNDGWAQHLNRDEKDDDLIDFLRAGAARVVVPVRALPADAGQVLSDYAAYLTSMSLPSLPELVDVGSPLYMAIQEELKARDGAEPETFDDEWEVRVPTELVRLRPDTALPTWSETLDANNKPVKGEWVEEQM